MSAEKNIDWDTVIKKEAIGIGGVDLGEVYSVEDAFIVTQKGLVDKKWYHIPISLVEDFDGFVLRLKVNEGELVRYEETEDKNLDSPSPSKSSDISKDTEMAIPLMGEKLEATKNVTEDKINITKEPVVETKTVEIELTHEEIFIERRPFKGDYHSYIASLKLSDKSSSPIDGPVEKKTQISIPIKKEEVIVSKTPYVKEEVVVKKKPVTETRQVSEDVTSERVNASDATE
jgi:uncharacterized protein (TIGR02271 family)